MTDPQLIYSLYIVGGWALGLTTVAVINIWRNNK